MTVPTTGPFQFNPGGGFDDALVEAAPFADVLAEVSDNAPLPQVTPAPPKAAKAPKKSVGDILELARERLAELKLELAEMAALQTEHDKLERLLEAADALVT